MSGVAPSPPSICTRRCAMSSQQPWIAGLKQQDQRSASRVNEMRTTYLPSESRESTPVAYARQVVRQVPFYLSNTDNWS